MEDENSKKGGERKKKKTKGEEIVGIIQNPDNP